MRIHALVAAVGVALLTGCSMLTSVQVIPVQGPLSTQKPLPVLAGRISGLDGSGFSLVLASGETCKGPLPLGRSTPDRDGAKAAAPRPGPDLAPAWDLVYGDGFYASTVRSAAQYGRSELVGDHGAAVFLELYCSGTRDYPVLGVAKDDNGNTYSLSFPQAYLSSVSPGPPPSAGSPHWAPAPDNGPRLVVPATGGAPVVGIPLGGGIYLPVTGGPPTPGIPLN